MAYITQSDAIVVRVQYDLHSQAQNYTRLENMENLDNVTH